MLLVSLPSLCRASAAQNFYKREELVPQGLMQSSISATDSHTKQPATPSTHDAAAAIVSNRIRARRTIPPQLVRANAASAAMQPQHKRLLAAAATGLAAAVAAHLLRRWRDRRRIARMTKVELHAHLNGSIRPATLRRLAAERGLDAACLDRKRTLEVCFEIFALIHKCVDSLEIVAVIAREFLEDLRKDGCAYVELRTTPRALQGRTEADYVRTVCRVLSEASGITARLLVSVDRSRGPEAAAKTLAEVAQLRRSDATVDRIAVGVDFSGNPTSKHGFDAFEHLFREVRDQWGLGCALHVGETPRSDGDSAKILAFAREKPRRVRFGHALAFSDDELRGCAS